MKEIPWLDIFIFCFQSANENGMASSNTLSCLCKKESRKHFENTEGCSELFAQEQPDIRSSQDVVEAGVFLIMTRGTVQIPVLGWFQDVSPSSQGICLLKILGTANTIGLMNIIEHHSI